MKDLNIHLKMFIILIILLTGACGGGPSAQPSSDEQAQADAPAAALATNPPEPIVQEPAVVEQATNTPEPSPTPAPTNTPEPSPTPEPTATSTPRPVGMTRNNPFPSMELIPAPHWDIQVLEMKRGEAAWADIQAANMFNDSAPEGMEYILVKVHVKSTYADSEEHAIGPCDFSVTGDQFKLYTCSMGTVVSPEPKLDAKLYSGGEAEGWVPFRIAQGEGNLLLVVDEIRDFDEGTIRYAALDAGAVINIDPGLADIAPTDLGKERANPAPRTEKIITDNWEVSIVDVVRGEPAWAMLQEANLFNSALPGGMEYILVKVHVRNISTEDPPLAMSGGLYFASTGSAGVLYDTPFAVPPSPSLDIYLFSGGEYEAWVAVQAAVGETGMLLRFREPFDVTNASERFISLEP